MQPKIDFFNDSTSDISLTLIKESIGNLSRFKPNISVRERDDYADYINFLSKKLSSPNQIHYGPFIKIAYLFKPFEPPTQKLILTDKELYLNGIIHDGVTHQRTPQYGCPSFQQAIIISTARNLSSSQLTAVIEHELGHAYGATNRNFNITQDYQEHCLTDYCVMNHPAFNEKTLGKIISGSSLYCSDCIQGLKDF